MSTRPPLSCLIFAAASIAKIWTGWLAGKPWPNFQENSAAIARETKAGQAEAGTRGRKAGDDGSARNFMTFSPRYFYRLLGLLVCSVTGARSPSVKGVVSDAAVHASRVTGPGFMPSSVSTVMSVAAVEIFLEADRRQAGRQADARPAGRTAPRPRSSAPVAAAMRAEPCGCEACVVGRDMRQDERVRQAVRHAEAAAEHMREAMLEREAAGQGRAGEIRAVEQIAAHRRGRPAGGRDAGSASIDARARPRPPAKAMIGLTVGT